MKTIHRLSCLAMVAALLFVLLTQTAFAVGKIAVDQDVALTIDYHDGDLQLPNAQFHIFKVADVDELVNMTLTSDFEPYRNTVTGLSSLDVLDQKGWMTLASTLKPYVERDSVVPSAQGFTDANGKLTFSLKPGLYLILGYSVTTDDFYTYVPTPYMIFLPGIDAETNSWVYSVTTTPKYSKSTNPPGDHKFITRKVLKQWDDDGAESIRPSNITVQLLCDGEVYDTQVLNKNNNWRYAWDNLSADHTWTVVEIEMSGYTVAIRQEGITFIITNTYRIPDTPSDLPVVKKLAGNLPAEPVTFRFVMTAENASCPMPDGSNGLTKEVTITGAGSNNFGTITFTTPGTYRYTVEEINTGVEGCTYDTTVYTVTYTVVLKDGQLNVTKTVQANGETAPEGVVFTNRFGGGSSSSSSSSSGGGGSETKKKLPNTGELWWPVPCLFFLGIVFIAVGVYRYRRYNG